MKLVALLIAFLCTAYANAMGLADSVRVKPIAISLSYKGDFLRNFRGGGAAGNAYLGLASLSFQLNTEAARLWKGGELNINLADAHGGIPSSTLVDAYQSVDNIEAGNRLFFQEFWYMQSFWKLEAKVGIQDLNLEFSVNDVGGLFLNSSFGLQSTFNDNLAVSVFPITGVGGVLKYRASRLHVVKLGIFDGNPNKISLYPSKFSWPFSGDDGLMYIGEYGYQNGILKSHKGTYKLGLYYHNHIPHEAKVGILPHVGNNYGMYFVANQQLLDYRNGNRYLDAFAQLSFSPVRTNNNHFYFGGGMVYGMAMRRMVGDLGIAFALAKFDDSIYSDEKIIEVTYKLGLIKPEIYIQPDLQLVINPSRFDIPVKNSLVGIIRFGFTLK